MTHCRFTGVLLSTYYIHIKDYRVLATLQWLPLNTDRNHRFKLGPALGTPKPCPIILLCGSQHAVPLGSRNGRPSDQASGAHRAVTMSVWSNSVRNGSMKDIVGNLFVSRGASLILPAKRGNFVVGLAIVPRPGPSEVLVRIEATALNPVECKIQTLGAYVETYPAILGTDAAGVVEEVGSKVTTLAKGDRIFWQGFFEPQYGTYQQYSVVPAELAAKIPSNFSFDKVSALPVAVCTAVLGMYNCNPASKSAHFIPPWEKDGLTANAGKPILIMGGASSVGQAVIQMARLSGFSPIVTTASPHNISLLTALGADHVLDRNISQQELLSQIATSMAGAPLTFAYDTISSFETQHVAYKALASGGTLIITWERLVTPAEERASEGKKIAEVFASVYAPENREVGVALFKQLPGWLESKALEPNTVEVLPDGLGGITTGLERLKVGVSATKLVVHPQETP